MTINCKETEYILVNKRDNSRFDLHIGDDKIKINAEMYFYKQCNRKRGKTSEI